MDNNKQSATTASSAQTDNGKTVAVISYLSIIGWVIALVLHNNNRTSLGVYHLRQTIALYVLALCLWAVRMFTLFVPYFWWIISIVFILVYIVLFVLWLTGFIAAVNGQEKPMPIIGQKAQQWFQGIK